MSRDSLRSTGKPLSIRKIEPKDEPLLRTFLEVLPHNTLMEYGRFNEQERPIAILEILHNLIAGTELGFGYFNELTPVTALYPDLNPKILILVGYLHFNLSNKFSRKGYQASLGIVVHPNYQGKGIGSELMRFGLEEMRKQGYTKIWLHVWKDNMPARKLYTHMGFRTEGIFERDQLIDGEAKDVVSMALFLD